jgi:zinc protease
MGYERDIAIMPTLYDYSRAFFARYYRPENTVLFVAGDVAPANVVALADKHYGGWQRGYVPPQIPVEPEQTAERRIAVGYDGQTLPLLQLAYKLPLYDPADRTRVAADLLADLAFGETSEAYRRLVLDEQVVEDLDAAASYNRDPGLLEIMARIKEPAKVDYVLGVIDATIAQFRTAEPDAKRLADLQKRLRYGFLMGLQTPDSLAARVAPFLALDGDLRGLDRLYATYAAITPADVRAAAERYLEPERRTVGVLESRQ